MNLLRSGVGGARGLEGDGDEGLAEDVEKDLRCEGAVFVEDLAAGGLFIKYLFVEDKIVCSLNDVPLQSMASMRSAQ